MKQVALDTETLGLTPGHHDVWEVSWQRLGESTVHTMHLPHDVSKADEKALEVNRYWERFPDGAPQALDQEALARLTRDLTDAIIIGANPAFDVGFLRRWMEPVWQYRLVDVETMAMVMLDEDRPWSLARIVDALNSRYDAGITSLPDHTSAGDVRATVAVYDAVRSWRGYVGGVAR